MPKTLLEECAENAGLDIEKMLQSASTDGIAWGICPVCKYTAEVEPDSRDGWCEVCEFPSVISCLELL